MNTFLTDYSAAEGTSFGQADCAGTMIEMAAFEKPGLHMENQSSMRICLIPGDNPHYVHSVVQALADTGVKIDLIGDDRYEHLKFSPNVTLFNFRGARNSGAFVIAKLLRVLRYYARCIAYMWRTDINVVHIQGFRFYFLEGVILLSLYRMFGKTIIYTAHNLRPKGRTDILAHLVSYLTFRLANHIICHTTKMRATLLDRYKISSDKVTVIRHGLNFSVPIFEVDQVEARRCLEIDRAAKVLLIFGKIRRYKGVDLALKALNRLVQTHDRLLLLVVGGGDNNDTGYLKTLRDYVDKEHLELAVKFHTDFIPDKDIALYFQAADLLLLPYREGEFQSGVLFLGYRFGLPAVVSDVGSIAEDVEDAVTGIVFRSEDPMDLATRVEDFYREVYPRPDLRNQIKQYALGKYSWAQLSRTMLEVYQRAQQPCGKIDAASIRQADARSGNIPT